MTMNAPDEDFEKFLESYGINATPRRIQILKILVGIPNKEFSFPQIEAQIKKEEPSASPSSIVMTLKLFKIRGIIKEAQGKRMASKGSAKRGRPETKYIYREGH